MVAGRRDESGGARTARRRRRQLARLSGSEAGRRASLSCASRRVRVNRVDLYMRDNGAGITHALPQVMGVEAAGVIAEAEPGSGLKAGMKAVLYSEAFCGKCRYCLAGDQPLCESVKIMGEHRHGGFAEYVAMPSRCFFPLARRRRSRDRRGADDRPSDSVANVVRQARAAARRECADRRHRRRRRGRQPSTREADRRARIRDLVERRQDRAGDRAWRGRRRQLREGQGVEGDFGDERRRGRHGDRQRRGRELERIR